MDLKMRVALKARENGGLSTMDESASKATAGVLVRKGRQQSTTPFLPRLQRLSLFSTGT
jgi:hypothetical protein